MSNTYNKVLLVGRLGKDPKSRTTADGMVITDLVIADNYMKDGTEKVQWIPVRVFGKQAESCDKFLRKGRNVLVEGRIDIQVYQDKQDLTKYTSVFTVVASRVLFLDSNQKPSVPPTVAKI